MNLIPETQVRRAVPSDPSVGPATFWTGPTGVPLAHHPTGTTITTIKTTISTAFAQAPFAPRVMDPCEESMHKNVAKGHFRRGGGYPEGRIGAGLRGKSPIHHSPVGL